jgi:hypothetical protein
VAAGGSAGAAAVADHRPRLGFARWTAVRLGEEDLRRDDAHHRQWAFGDGLGGGRGIVFGVEVVEERGSEGVRG